MKLLLVIDCTLKGSFLNIIMNSRHFVLECVSGL